MNQTLIPGMIHLFVHPGTVLIKFNRIAAVCALLSCVACVSPYFTRIDIMEATWHADREDLKRHLKYEPEMIDGLTESSQNFAPLHAASMMGDMKMVKILIRNGARTHLWGSGGVYPIHCAAEGGHKDLVKYFLARGFDLDEGGAEGTPLHYAIKGGHYELVRYLLDKGADIQNDVFNAPTPLHVAARSGQPKISLLLIERGADLYALDVRDRTPYDLALHAGNYHTATVLREQEDQRLGNTNLAP